MGVPAYEGLTAGAEWPPFAFDSMTSSTQKKLAGNVSWSKIGLNFLLITTKKLPTYNKLYTDLCDLKTKMMHSAVAGAVWASVLATFEWQPDHLASSGRVASEKNRMIDDHTETETSIVLADQSAKVTEADEPAVPKFGFTLDGFDWLTAKCHSSNWLTLHGENHMSWKNRVSEFALRCQRLALKVITTYYILHTYCILHTYLKGTYNWQDTFWVKLRRVFNQGCQHFIIELTAKLIPPRSIHFECLNRVCLGCASTIGVTCHGGWDCWESCSFVSPIRSTGTISTSTTRSTCRYVWMWSMRRVLRQEEKIVTYLVAPRDSITVRMAMCGTFVALFDTCWYGVRLLL